MYEILVIKMINYFLEIINNINASLIIAPEVPHAFGDYCLVVVAKAFNIKYLCFKGAKDGRAMSRIYDITSQKHLISDNLKDLGSEKEIQLLIDQYNILQHLDKTPYTKSYLQEFISDKKRSIREVHKLVSQDSKLIKLLSMLAERKYKHLSPTAFRTNQNPYIVVCLHYEPEANICPFGGIYSDQIAFIAKVNAICERNNFVFFVREHPDQFSIPPSGYSANMHWLTNEVLQPRSHAIDNQIKSFTTFRGFCNRIKLSEIVSDGKCKATASVNGNVLLQFAINGKIGICGPSFGDQILITFTLLKI